MDDKIAKDIVRELKLIRKELSRANDIQLMDILAKQSEKQNIKIEGENE